MCTLIALHRAHRDLPLVVAANRDELYARPTEGPRVLAESPRVVGGRDVEKGGTWLALSARGLFVGLTNQRSAALADRSRRSRGEVVLGAAAHDDLDGALAFLAALDGREFNPFNLLLGDGARLFVCYARSHQAPLEVHELPTGIWALPNDRLHSPDFPKAARAVELAQPLTALPWEELVPRAQAMLADHALPDALPDASGPPIPSGSPLASLERKGPASLLPPELRARLQALCVHTPSYGTRSATLLAVAPGRVLHYLHAEGPPCEAPLVERTDLLR